LDVSTGEHRTFPVEDIGSLPDQPCSGSWRADVRSEATVMFRKKTPTPISLEAILQRIAEIDHKFKQTDPWLHST
jgi:hypothetical protein